MELANITNNINNLKILYLTGNNTGEKIEIKNLINELEKQERVLKRNKRELEAKSEMEENAKKLKHFYTTYMPNSKIITSVAELEQVFSN